MISTKQIILFLSLLLQVRSFTVHQPLSLSPHVASLKQYRVTVSLQMSGDAASEAEMLRAKARALKEEAAALAGTTVDEMEKKEQMQVQKSGDLYDDETPAYKDPISDNMRARLMKEASTGLDSEKKQTNVILYICIAVAILVGLGGEGILY